MATKNPRDLGLTILTSATVLVGLGLVVLSYWVFKPLWEKSAVQKQARVEVPPYDHRAWHAIPVQADGRVKPFKTACTEAMRVITGRSEFEILGQEEGSWTKIYRRMVGQGHLNAIDSVAVVLQWHLLNGTSTDKSKFVDWENYAFILCEQQELRKEIYKHLDFSTMSEAERYEKLHGKYISPADLRSSAGFENLLDEARALRMKDREKGQFLISPVQAKAEEVAQRLVLFDSICQNNPSAKPRRQQHEDPYAFVALDKVPGGAWFSFGHLQKMQASQALWGEAIRDRLGRTPQLYIKPEYLAQLKEFQKNVRAGQWQQDLNDLVKSLDEQSEKRARDFIQKDIDTGGSYARSLVHELMAGGNHDALASRLRDVDMKNPEAVRNAIADRLRSIGKERNQEAIENLKRRIEEARAKRYDPDNPEFRMLHINYLETRFPNIYEESLTWQTFPEEKIDKLLQARTALKRAYQSSDPVQFDQEAKNFLATIASVNSEVGPYPGEDTAGMRLAGMFWGRPLGNPDASLLKLENQFNRAQPFMWAWVVMLVSICFFIASLALDSGRNYKIGFVFFAGALGLMLYGFYCRMAVSGRPPVSNMYETLVWVPFMTAVFALILECIYRRGVIIMAGASATALGLVLADQLPLELGQRINNLVPVLRSNYWLTIHVITIVSSYAGGALAWALGNVALVLLAFGSPRKELLKTLAQFSYRAMQISVLLLAAGTFLGGWWAAESWGRFWGWDPKETWALIALVCYVIPLHMRYLGWIRDFGMSVAAVVCFASIVMSWYGVNFVLGVGLHSYGFGTGSPWAIFFVGLLNIEWVLVAAILYYRKLGATDGSSISESGAQAELLSV